MAERPALLTGWWTSTSESRQLVLLAVAYLAAVASLVSYVSSNGGTGMPSRLQMALMLFPVAVVYCLSLRTTD